jgi:FkbM family methyltransferase
MAVYTGDHLALTTTIYGHKMYVDTRDLSLAPHILLDGYWERPVTDVFLSVLRPGMRVVEIGPNSGWFSLLAAELVGSSGKLVLFEPNPRMADILMRNMSINGFLDRSQVVDKAVFSASQRIEFGVYEKYAGGSGLFANKAQAARAEHPAASLHPQFNDVLRMIEVEAVALDSYFAPGIRIDLMKIDAEGAEPHILAGAGRLLEENKHMQIILEFSPRLLRLGGSSPETFYDGIRAWGFRIFRIEPDLRLLESELSQLMQDAGHHDVLLRR